MVARNALGIAVAVSLACAAGGCTRVRDHQGYVADQEEIASIQVGTPRDTVVSTLGRPTFVGQFDERDWYYVSRETRNLAYNNPKPFQQTVLHIRFDEAGNVAAVERRGMEQVASIDPDNRETPTLGREKGFFEELFGNIGAVGSGPISTRTDQPQ